MARVLMSAYACAPDQGSEAIGGWTWVRWTVLEGHDVTVLTLPEMAQALAASRAVEELGAAGERLEVVAVPPDPWTRLFRQRFRVYSDYLSWQQASARRAAVLHEAEPFDVVHHVSWGSLIWGTPLWTIGAPLIFGPVGGGQVSDPRLKDYFGDTWPQEALRTGLTRHVLPHNPRTRATLRHAAVVAVTNADTERTVRALGATNVVSMLDNGLSAADEVEPAPPPERAPGQLELLWVGRLLALKGLPLALEAVALAARRCDVQLVIAGDGPQGPAVSDWIAELGVQDRVRSLGMIPHAEVLRRLSDADGLLFTSLRESFGAQVLEAAAKARPVIALDQHGVATHLPEDAWWPVEIGDRATTVRRLADAIVDMAWDVEARHRAGRSARAFALDQRWSARVRRLHAALPADRRSRGEMRIGMLGPVATVDVTQHLDGDGVDLPAGIGAPVVSLLVSELIARGHHVHLWTLAEGITADVHATGPSLSIRYVPRRSSGRGRDMYRVERDRLRAAIDDDLLDHAVDVLHAHWSYEFPLAVRHRDEPLIVTVHDWAPRVLRYMRDPYRFTRLLMFLAVHLRRPRMTTPSPYLRQKLRRHGLGVAAVVPNGVADADVVAEPRRRGEGREVLSIANGFSDLKNIKRLLQAASLLRAGGFPVRLELVGTQYGPDEPAERWARDHGLADDVVFTGPLDHDQVLERLRRCDLLVHPALEESFGMVLAEAMAQGTPVVGGRSSGAVPWVLGDVGVLVDVTDPSQIAAAIRALLSDPERWEALSARGLRAVTERFSMSVVADGYERAYRAAMAD